MSGVTSESGFTERSVGEHAESSFSPQLFALKKTNSAKSIGGEYRES